LREVTTAISAMAKTPFAKRSKKIKVISSTKDDIFLKLPTYPTTQMGANRNIFMMWSKGSDF
jgi:hypothetical protein